MSDNQNLPPLEEGQDLKPEQGFIIPDNYDLKHAAYYAHVYGPHDELLGSAIVDKGSVVQFDPGVEHEFDGMHVKLRYGTAVEPPTVPLVINLYAGWDTEGPVQTVLSYDNDTNLTFSLSGTGTMDWTTEYDSGTGEPIPGSTTTFLWGDGSGFPTGEYEISVSIVDRYESANGLNYPYLTIAENQFFPVTEGFSIGIREQGFVDSGDGYIILAITLRDANDPTNVVVGTLQVDKMGIDAGDEVPMVFTIDTSLAEDTALPPV